MTKNSLILTYFQKSHLLTVENPFYRKTLTSLFTFLAQTDKTDNDQTTRLLRISGTTKAFLIARENMMIAGLEEIAYIIREKTSLTLRPIATDRQRAKKGEKIAEIVGTAATILAYERTIVNILQRMSGIASLTNHLIQRINSNSIYIAATRKTPWMSLDKKAVSVGGGLTHRLSLGDGIIVKDNHIVAIKNIYTLRTLPDAIKKSLEIIIPQAENNLVEIEVKTEEEARTALTTYNYLALLFDNFTTDELAHTITRLRKEFDLSEVILEASGGINEKNIAEFAQTGVDILSLGSLTHSAPAANISLEF